MHDDASAPVWAADERLLIRLVDALHDLQSLPQPLWRELAEAFSDEQIIEAITLTGFYHTISFLVRGLDLPLEPYAARFPTASDDAPLATRPD